MKTYTGEVKFYFSQKGYGFIRYKPEQDIFFHATKVKGLPEGDELKEGDIVQYEVTDTPRGKAAKNIRKK